MDIAISKLTRPETPQLMAFMAQNLDNWSTFNKLWRWREQGLPESGGEEAVIADDGNNIVGCVGIVPFPVSINGRLLQACWQQDSLVSEAARGKGVGKKLVLEAEKSYPLIMAKGTSKAMYGLRRALGYMDVPFSDYLMAVYRPAFDNISFFKTSIEMMLGLWRKLLWSPRKQDPLVIKKIHCFNPYYNEMAAMLAKEPGVRPLKNTGYLNWRYFQCPLKEYTVLQAGEECPRGVIVLGISNQNPKEGWVVDMLCPSNDRICAYSLLTEANRYFTQWKVKHVLAFATLPAARRWLMRFGFVPTRRSPRFTFKYNNTNSTSNVLSNARWNFWHGDGDLDLYL